MSTNSRTYERCHVLVLADALCAAESLWPGVTCQHPPHDGDGHRAEDDRSIYSWSTAAVDAAKRGDCPGCRQRPCVCSERCSCGQHDGSQ